MGKIHTFNPELLVIGVLSTKPEAYTRLCEMLETAFGPIAAESPHFPFTFTDYYNPEMGEGIIRNFYTFTRLVDPSTLASIKICTNEIEEIFADNSGARKINLDPGILSAERFVLATTKNRGHRIPLQDGIYGEVTLLYTKKEYQTLPWTYADFKTDAYSQLLKEYRADYLQKLHELQALDQRSQGPAI